MNWFKIYVGSGYLKSIFEKCNIFPEKGGFLGYFGPEKSFVGIRFVIRSLF